MQSTGTHPYISQTRDPLATSVRCGLQYVGETGLHLQTNSHCFNITYGRIDESPVVAHLTSEGHTEANYQW